MTIENTLDRIASALEAQAEATTQQNTLLAALLERIGTGEAPATAEPAKATRTRSKKTDADATAAAVSAQVDAAVAAAESAAAAEPAAAPAPAAAAPAPSPAATPAPAAAAPATTGTPPTEEVQAFAAALAQRLTPTRVVELIKKTGSNNISSMSDAQRASFWTDLQALDAETSAASALA